MLNELLDGAVAGDALEQLGEAEARRDRLWRQGAASLCCRNGAAVVDELRQGFDAGVCDERMLDGHLGHSSEDSRGNVRVVLEKRGERFSAREHGADGAKGLGTADSRCRLHRGSPVDGNACRRFMKQNHPQLSIAHIA